MFSRSGISVPALALVFLVCLSSPVFPQEKESPYPEAIISSDIEAIPKAPLRTDDDKRIFRPAEVDLTRNGYLLDQDGHKINMVDFLGKVVLMDFIYTGCKTGHCMYLNNKMRFISKKFRDELGTELRLASITFDPEVDTVDVLKEYSANWESDPARWAFLTGARGDIMDIMKKFDILFMWDAKDESYNHSMRTILIDRTGHVVREYHGMGYKLQNVINDIKALLDNRPLPPQK